MTGGCSSVRGQDARFSNIWSWLGRRLAVPRESHVFQKLPPTADGFGAARFQERVGDQFEMVEVQRGDRARETLRPAIPAGRRSGGARHLANWSIGQRQREKNENARWGQPLGQRDRKEKPFFLVVREEDSLREELRLVLNGRGLRTIQRGCFLKRPRCFEVAELSYRYFLTF